MSVFVCLSVCKHISGNSYLNFTKFSVHVNDGCGSVLLWWRCGRLCTSGFADGVVFSYDGLYGGVSVPHHAVSLQCDARANTPAARYRLRFDLAGAKTRRVLCARAGYTLGFVAHFKL